jgi:uncharacterized membrane protein YedE/YeeE
MASTCVRYAIYGLLFGFVLSRTGFTNYAEVHNMFVFADLRLIFTFGGTVAVLAVAYALLTRKAKPESKPFHKGTIPGGILFGAGWALTGACPAIVMVQVGEGQLIALATVAGILVGTWLYPKVHARFFKWDTGSCNM